MRVLTCQMFSAGLFRRHTWISGGACLSGPPRVNDLNTRARSSRGPNRKWHTHVKGPSRKIPEDESQTLEYRYRPHSTTDVTTLIQASSNKNLSLIAERYREFNNLELNSATLQEEQERELSPEIEQERQVRKPAPAQPAAHHIHYELLEFVSTGVPISGAEAYQPAFEVLRNTSAAKHLDVSQFPNDLLATADFARPA
jgi:hypothetical protein